MSDDGSNGGFDRVMKKFNTLDKKIRDQVLRKALRDGAKVLQQRAIADAPVLTGATKEAIKVRAGKRSRSRISMLCGMGKAWFTGNTFYAAFVEFGHKIGARAFHDSKRQTAYEKLSGNTRPFVDGLHWFRKAALNTKATCRAAINSGIQRYMAELLKEMSNGG